jgi:hypothetical protein
MRQFAVFGDFFNELQILVRIVSFHDSEPWGEILNEPLCFLLASTLYTTPTKLITREFKETVAIHRITVHQDIATSSPFANGVLSNAQVFCCSGGVKVVGKFIHGIPLA